MAWKGWRQAPGLPRYPPRRAPGLDQDQERYQEVIIGGRDPAEGTRAHTIGSLILGTTRTAGGMPGNVGTAFTEAMVAGLMRRLGPLQRDTSRGSAC